MERGDSATAAVEIFETLRLAAQATPEPTPRVMLIAAEHAGVLWHLGSDTVGLALAERSYNWIQDTVGPIDGQLERISTILVNANATQGRHAQALRWATRELGHARRLNGDGAQDLLQPMISIARTQLRLGHADAATSANQALALAAKHHASPASLHRLHGEQALSKSNLAAASEAFAEAARQARDGATYDRSEEGEALAALAEVQRKLGDATGADRSLRDAIAALRTGSYWHKQRADALQATVTGLAPQEIRDQSSTGN